MNIMFFTAMISMMGNTMDPMESQMDGSEGSDT
jgi:hypothetical protein